MAFCGKCGAYAPQDARFCSACGNDLHAAQSSNNKQHTEEKQYEQYVYRHSYGTGDSEDNKIISVLCYFGILLIIPYVLKPNSQFVKYHSNQGLLLLFAVLACMVVGVVPLIGWLAALVGWVFCFICWLTGIINVLKGQTSPLPIIGKYTILK